MLRTLVTASLATLSAAGMCSPTPPRRERHADAKLSAKQLGQHGEVGILCDDVACEETPIILTNTPLEKDELQSQGMVCELQEGLEMDGSSVWACGHHSSSSSRGGDAHMSLSDTAGVSVSDLGLTMADLEEALPSELLGGIDSSGYQSTSRLGGDQGVVWSESATEVEAELTIPGLRGQPAGAMAVAVTDTTCTITAFGMLAWSCVLLDEVDAASAQFSAEDGPSMVPVVRVKATKRRPGRWGGFLRAIGEDSVLQ